jgi:hypothetical protein
MSNGPYTTDLVPKATGIRRGHVQRGAMYTP